MCVHHVGRDNLTPADMAARVVAQLRDLVVNPAEARARLTAFFGEPGTHKTEAQEASGRFIRSYVKKLRAGGTSLGALASRFGVSHAHMSCVAAGKRGAGPKMEEAVARELFDGSVDRLRAEAARYHGAPAQTGA